MTHVRSIDGLINSIPEAQPINPAKPSSRATKPEVVTTEATPPQNDNEVTPKAPQTDDKSAKPDVLDTPTNEYDTEPAATEPAKDTTTAENTDEYGNPVAKPKMYSEEDVQRMIRERLARGRFKDEAQPTQQPTDQATANGFKYDPESTEGWETQLENFVERTVQKLSSKQAEAVQKARNDQIQAEFEMKFTHGMSKHADFATVMEGKNISNAMLMATRGLDNPAGFLYAAAKQAPAELDRISKISDPYQQVAEMGRLNEKLRRSKTPSKAAAPLSPDRSDVSDKNPARTSIDHLIHEHNRERFKR